jgi:hypothetical protein
MRRETLEYSSFFEQFIQQKERTIINAEIINFRINPTPYLHVRKNYGKSGGKLYISGKKRTSHQEYKNFYYSKIHHFEVL